MQNYWEYVRDFTERQPKTEPGTLLRFKGIGEKDAYNPALIEQDGREYLAMRVESPGSYWLDLNTYDPEIRFFQEEEGVWEPVEGTPVFSGCEDPSASWVTDEAGQRKLVFSRVVLDRSGQVPQIVTEFFMGDSIAGLDPAHPFTEVRGMKDIRLIQLPEGDIAVCGRPVGGPAEHGRASFLRIKRIEELNTQTLSQAPLLAMDLDAHTKVGTNALYLVPSTVGPQRFDIGALGHLAIGKEGIGLHYAMATWIIDVATGECGNPRICALRSDFELYPGKFHWINDVAFPGGLKFLDNEVVRIYAGLGDTRTGTIILPNPFAA